MIIWTPRAWELHRYGAAPEFYLYCERDYTANFLRTHRTRLEFILSVPEENLMAISWVSSGYSDFTLSKSLGWGLFLYKKILQMSVWINVSQKGIKMYAFCMCSNFRAHEILNTCRTHLLCSNVTDLKYLQTHKNLIAFFGNIYPDICTIFVYKHNPQPTKTWTK